MVYVYLIVIVGSQWPGDSKSRISSERFNELSKVCKTECASMGDWFVLDKRLTREDAIAKYGKITDEEFGPRGGYKSVTFGDKKFISRCVAKQ